MLSGHLHSWRADLFASTPEHASILQIHAGTGLSDRLRGEENDFNLLTLSGDTLEIDRFVSGDTAADFTRAAHKRFRRDPTGWQAI